MRMELNFSVNIQRTSDHGKRTRSANDLEWFNRDPHKRSIRKVRLLIFVKNFLNWN